jgi:hypothetical protein
LQVGHDGDFEPEGLRGVAHQPGTPLVIGGGAV